MLIAFGWKALTFLTSKAGVYLLIAGGVGALWWAVDSGGYNRAMRACQAAALQAKLEAANVDLKAATDAAEDLKRARDESAARAIDAEAQLKRIEDDAKNHPVAGCLATDNDVRLRLQNSGRGAR